MEIRSFCPFAVSAFVWEAAKATYSLTIVVKASFLLVNGAEATLASSQDEPGPDVFLDEDPEKGLCFASDWAPLKPRTDVLVVGHVVSPGGQPTTEMDCRIEIGDFSKSASFLGGSANLGPISPASPERRRLLSDEGFGWAMAASDPNRGPAPEGLDFGFFNAAPADQQIAMLRPGSNIILENLHPTAGRMESRLPQAKPQAFRIDPRSGRVNEVMLRCDTVTVDADRGRVILVFRGLTDIPSPEPVAIGTVVVASHPQGKRVRPVDIEKVVRQGGSIADVAGAPELHPLEVRHDTRPLGRARPHETVAGPPQSSAGGVLPFQQETRSAPHWTQQTAPVPADLDPSFATLPFQGARAPASKNPAASGGLPFGASTVHLGALPVRPATPFERKVVEPQAVEIPKLATPAPQAQAEEDEEPEPITPQRPSALPVQAAQPFGSTTLLPSAFPSAKAMPFAPKDAVRPEIVAHVVCPAKADESIERKAPTRAEQLEASLPLSLQKLASLAAEVASPTADVLMVLRRHGLDEAEWARISAETTAVLAEDAARGEGELLRRYDEMYIGRMADLGRNPDIHAYALLYLASARRQVSRCLAELGLGAADWMPLRRSLSRSIESDAARMAELRHAIEALRADAPLPEVGFFARQERAK